MVGKGDCSSSPLRGARRFRSCLLPLLSLLVLGVQPSERCNGNEIEREFLLHAPKILQSVREKGYNNVGVLKFRIRQGDRAASDRNGTLNLELARRLTIALILKNDIRKPVGILADANAVAAGLPGASHLTERGRAILFNELYPLAWGEKSVRPDAFITGCVDISPDLKTARVGFLFVDRKDGLLPVLKEGNAFEVNPEPSVLMEVGESFLLRGLFDEEETPKKLDPKQDDVVSKPKDKVVERKPPALPKDDKAKHILHGVQQAAVAVKSGRKEDHPMFKPGAPVSLKVRYGKVLQEFRFKDGMVYLPEPREGEEVTLTLVRNDRSSARYGVVLKVNGLNTLGKERVPDDLCQKWILGPENDVIELLGYQVDDGRAEKFVIRSEAESRAREINYGAHVGTISMAIFTEIKGDKKPLPPDLPHLAKEKGREEEQDFGIALDVTQRGVLPEERASNLNALQTQLVESGKTRPRGLIEGGDQIGFKIRRVEFHAYPEPLMNGVVFYYQPTATLKNGARSERE